MIVRSISFLFIAILIIGSTRSAHAQRSLLFNSFDKVARLDYSTSPPGISYIPVTGFESIGHAEDASGNLRFLVNSSGVYNANYQQMPGSVGINVHPSSAEMSVCPFPGNPDKYFVIYNNQTCTQLQYSVVDMSLNSGLGDVVQLNSLLDPGAFAEGMELIKRPCLDSYWYIAYECGIGFKRFLVDESGISAGTQINSYAPPPGLTDGRGELEYHKGKIGFTFNWLPYIVLADFDPLAGTISNEITLSIPSPYAVTGGVFGLEFSHDASKAYITAWYEDVTDNLFQYDFSTGSISYYMLTSPMGPNAWTGETGPGQIEMGPDKKLYVVMNGGTNIAVIDNANSSAPSISYIVTTASLGLGISDHIQSSLFEDNDPITNEIPNVFTPNDDSKNAYFEVQGLAMQSMQIYDRWGVLLFSSNDAAAKWDGTYKGKPMPEGVYYYMLSAASECDGSVREAHGYVTLLR